MWKWVERVSSLCGRCRGSNMIGYRKGEGHLCSSSILTWFVQLGLLLKALNDLAFSQA